MNEKKNGKAFFKTKTWLEVVLPTASCLCQHKIFGLGDDEGGFLLYPKIQLKIRWWTIPSFFTGRCADYNPFLGAQKKKGKLYATLTSPVKIHIFNHL